MNKKTEDFNNFLRELAKETQSTLLLTEEPTDEELRGILCKVNSKDAYAIFKRACEKQKKASVVLSLSEAETKDCQ